MTPTPSSYAVSVLVSDRTGIMRGITSAITDLGGDIQGISQTVVQSYFTVVLIAAFEQAVPAETVRCAIFAAFDPGEVSVVVRDFHLSQFPRIQGSRYILTLMGREAPGILKELTTYLAENNINIEDWYFRIEGKMVTHIGEITVPDELDIRRIQDALRTLLEPRGLRVHCRHENLFRATNEVQSITTMTKRHVPNR